MCDQNFTNVNDDSLILFVVVLTVNLSAVCRVDMIPSRKQT